MGIERRGGQRYYYRKVRRGKQVFSQYLGGGEVAELAATLETEDRLLAAAQRQVEVDQRGKIEGADRQIDEALQLARVIADGVLLLAGLHSHKGQWRKKRG